MEDDHPFISKIIHHFSFVISFFGLSISFIIIYYDVAPMELLPPHQFRSEFKVHGIEMIPFSTPYKTMLFEDVHDALRYCIAIGEDFVFIGAIADPLPIM